MKIAFFSEAGYTGVPPRDHPNARVDIAWPVILKATHHPILTAHTLPSDLYDIGILIIPKQKETVVDYPMVSELKRVCKKVATVQEGAHWYFQDYEIPDQIWYFNILMEMDFLLAHNLSDRLYYAGLTGKPSFVMPTVIIEENIKKSINKIDATIIGGNLVSVYGGFDSYTIALELEKPVYAISTGRMKPEEREMGIIHLPWMQWSDWITKLSEFKCAVQLQRVFSAGTFALNCAMLGIPCIGYRGIDTQSMCHPELSVDVSDLQNARRLARKLRDDDKFYTKCSESAYNRYKLEFSEQIFVKKWNNIMKEIKI